MNSLKKKLARWSFSEKNFKEFPRIKISDYERNTNQYNCLKGGFCGCKVNICRYFKTTFFYLPSKHIFFIRTGNVSILKIIVPVLMCYFFFFIRCDVYVVFSNIESLLLILWWKNLALSQSLTTIRDYPKKNMTNVIYAKSVQPRNASVA